MFAPSVISQVTEMLGGIVIHVSETFSPVVKVSLPFLDETCTSTAKTCKYI